MELKMAQAKHQERSVDRVNDSLKSDAVAACISGPAQPCHD